MFTRDIQTVHVDAGKIRAGAAFNECYADVKIALTNCKDDQIAECTMNKEDTTKDPKNSSFNSNTVVEVVPGLWLGGLAALSEIRKIPRLWTVISVLKSPKLKDFIHQSVEQMMKSPSSSTERAIVENLVDWELPDQSQADFISPRLEEILEQIDLTIPTPQQQDDNHSQLLHDKAMLKQACLVHCAFGVSRSVSVCAAWLISRRRYQTVFLALQHIRRVRPEASPNMGFLAGLRALEQTEGNVRLAMERIKPRSSNG